MSEPVGLRKSMAWIHTWLGLLAGWILFAMFVTGTASYFRPEITRWMQPEIDVRPVSAAVSARAAIAHLQKVAPSDEQWTIYLPDDRTVTIRAFTRARPDPDPKAPRAPRKPEMRLDPMTGDPLAARDTRGGEHFYRFHFQLQLPHPWGRWLAGICAMFMLTAIISGVITHKRIFIDFFTLRWGKGQRSWLDAHNVSAVVALPFHAMITYTGLITLVAMYMPWPVMSNYARPAAFAAEAFGSDGVPKFMGKPAPLTPIAPLIADASRLWRGGQPGYLIVANPNDASSTVTVVRSGRDTLNARGQAIVYSGVDGHRMSIAPPQGPAIATAGVMLGLHMGQFAGPFLRWTYFLLGMSGAAMVGTGLVLWTAKRRQPGAVPSRGFRIVERLNIGVIACLPIGMAAFFHANRLLPADLAGRADMEVAAMFWVWFGVAGLSLVRPVRRAWVEMLALAGVAFGALPLVDMLTTDRGLPVAIIRGDGLFVAFDLVMIALAALFGFAAWRASRVGRRPSPHRQLGSPIVAVRELADAA